METNSTHGKVKEIRKTKVDIISELAFKKAIRGYKCKEVEDYIHTLKNNMQLSETAFKEKLEEYSSASAMYSLERDKLQQNLKEAEKEIAQLKVAVQVIKDEAQAIRDEAQVIKEEALLIRNEAQVIIEREKTILTPIQKENEDLKFLVEDLKLQIVNDEKNNLVMQEIEEITQSNKELTAQVNELIESKDNLDLENKVLLNESDRMTKQIEKLNIENEDLKRTINALRVSKRNNAMNTNMKVFEYKQNHQLNVEIISSNVNELTKSLSAMRTALHELIENTKLDLNADD